MKNRLLSMAIALAILGAPQAYATETLATPVSSSTSGADAAAQAAGGTVNMAPISVAPVQTANPVSGSTSGADASASANPVVSPTISPVNNNTSGANAGANATLNGGNTTVSPTITGGNSSATGGNASLQNSGNAMLHGTVSGTNTLNGNVQGSVSGTNTVGVNATTGNNTNNVKGGDQTLNNKTDVNNTVRVDNGPITVAPVINSSGGQGGTSASESSSSSTSSVKDSGNSHSTSSVSNSGNSQSGSSSSSSSQGGSVSHVGNVSNAGNSSVVINNPKPLPPAPGIITPNSAAPTLFDQRGLPANAKGLDLAIRFMRACPSTYVKGTKLSEVREKGDSGRTSLIFTPHSNYAKYSNGKDVGESDVVEIPDNAKAGEFRYLCLGLIQSEALAKEASDVPIQTVIGDAVRFAGDNLSGFSKIHLVLIPKEALSVNMGVDAGGKGFGIAPGASGMISSLLATLSAGYSSNTGQTFPAAQLGGTFLVVAEGSFPESAAYIDFAPAQPVVSEAEKQLSAMRAELANARAAAIAAQQQETKARIAQSEAEAERSAAEAQARAVKHVTPQKPVKHFKKPVTKTPCPISCVPK